MFKKKKALDTDVDISEVKDVLDIDSVENIDEDTPKTEETTEVVNEVEEVTEVDTAEEAEKTDKGNDKDGTFMGNRTGGLYIDEAEKEEFLEQLRKKKKKKRIIQTVVIFIIVAIAAFIVYNLAFGDNKDNIKWPNDYLVKSEPLSGTEISEDEYKSDTLFATKKDSNGNDVTLKYNAGTDLIQIDVTEADGVSHNFRSWPMPSEDESATVGENIQYSKNHNIISSPVLVSYTKSGIEGGNTFAVNQMEHNKIVNKVENGFQIQYMLHDISCSFYIEFTLNDDGELVVNVPVLGISEPQPTGDKEADKMPRIASITVLPYMTASRQGDSGYYVTPDGSGALTYFDVARISNNNEYVKRIYGYDYTFDSFTSPDYNNETVSLPVFGAIQNVDMSNGRISNRMISSFVTKGEASASIVMGAPGMKNLDFYYIGYQFNFREFYYNSISKNGDVYKFLEEDIGVGDIQATYLFDVRSSEYNAGEETAETDLSKNAYTYVDLAINTRNYIKEKWGNDKKIDEDADLINLKVLLGAENVSSTSLISGVKVMTTFSDVRDIYESLAENGASDIRLSLLGWQNDGYYGNITKKYSIESDFGGKSDLKDLTNWAKDEGVVVSADNNLLQLYSAPKAGISLRNAVVKEPGTSYLKFNVANSAGVYRTGTEFYYMSPLYFNNKLLSKDIEKIDKLGFDNVDLQQVGNLLYTDYNKKNALLRQQALNKYQEWIKEYKETFNEVSVYYGYEYAVKEADILLDIPTTSSRLFLIDDTVPFMQIVYHGLIDYYCEPINRDDHPEVALLKAIEYGCLFSYEVTKENTVELKYTYYNDLFKSEFDLLDEDIVEAYKIAESTLKNLRTSEITNHYCVDEVRDGNVFCTEYSNGSKIYVNYGDTDYTISEGMTVASMDILLVE